MEVFERRHEAGARCRRLNGDVLLVRILDIWPQRLEFAQMLTFVHNGRPDMFNERSSYVLRYQTLMSG